MIDGGTAAALVGLGGGLVLVTAALRGRRIGGRSLGVLAVAWIAIILALWAIASFGLSLGRTNFT